MLGAKAVIENSIAGAQDELRRRTPSPDTPRNPHTWRPVPAVMDFILSFKTHAVAERDVGTHAPVVLKVESSVIGGDFGIRVALRERKLSCVWRSSALQLFDGVLIGNRTRYAAASRGAGGGSVIRRVQRRENKRAVEA